MKSLPRWISLTSSRAMSFRIWRRWSSLRRSRSRMISRTSTPSSSHCSAGAKRSSSLSVRRGRSPSSASSETRREDWSLWSNFGAYCVGWRTPRLPLPASALPVSGSMRALCTRLTAMCARVCVCVCVIAPHRWCSRRFLWTLRGIPDLVAGDGEMAAALAEADVQLAKQE